MSEKISAEDELAILNVLQLAGSGMTFEEVGNRVKLEHPKLAAVLDALTHKGHVRKNALKYFLQKPFASFTEIEEKR